MNANDLTSKFYDSVTSILRPEELTLEELSLIKSLTKSGGSILDVGAGTGRHAISLAELGYKVTALEDSKEMIKILELKNENRKPKNEKIRIINTNIFSLSTFERFNLITLFWNTFNEICLTEESGIKLLQKLKKSLAANGEILINIDDPTTIDPAHFNFQYEFTQDDSDYVYNWKTVKYDSKTNTSTSQEQISNGHQAYITNITQRYWSLEEIQKLCKEVGFEIKVKKLKTSDELYLILKSLKV